MELITTRRHLLSAVRALGTGADSIADRLRAAHEGGLRHIARNPGIPEHLRPDFDALMAGLDDLFKHKRVDEGRAVRLAKQVVILYQRVVKEHQ